MHAVTNQARWAFNISALRDLLWQPEKSPWVRRYEFHLRRETEELREQINAGNGAVSGPVPTSVKMLQGLTDGKGWS